MTPLRQSIHEAAANPSTRTPQVDVIGILAADRQAAAGFLDVLALRLARDGWYARIDDTSPERPPRVYVANLDRPRTEHIVAAPCADRTWWFCFERGEPIATTAELDTTVDRISRALSGPDG